ncbi:hypothetical protein ATANTOWER_026582 [Ataeniobius toweri]|uniref:Uncharacterized protein n=1 Tax=Ataeniobius toweri TaxID=208326 RepID=A0ABU7BMS4_9TELE|nr:hypothetical protein [Ataeniobius toweri]
MTNEQEDLISSEITSWEHLTIAHLPIHPSTRRAQLKHSCPRIRQREWQHSKSHGSPPPELSLCGEDLPLPTNHHPPPTCQSRSLL